MQVPLLDLKREYSEIKPEIDEAIAGVLAHTQFILGPEVKSFEEKLAQYCNAGFGVGCASGTDALLLSLRAVGVGHGDEVIAPTFSFFATAGVISQVGAVPVFVDIKPDSYNLDPSQIEKRITSKTKAIIPVHLFGQCAEMDPILSIAKKHKLAVIEDAAQAIGARYKDSKAGSLGDLGCFSFFPTKTLGGIGDGGLVVSDQKDLADRVRMLRVHGENSKYHHQAVGLNSRLDAIQAAVLMVKLRHVDEWCEERIGRARRYQKLFSETGLVGEQIIGLPPLSSGKGHVFNCYVIRVEQRDDLWRYLGERGVQTEVYYPLPLHLQPCFAHLGYHKGSFPNAELAAAQVLTLPMYPELTPEQQEFVVREMRNFYRK